MGWGSAYRTESRSQQERKRLATRALRSISRGDVERVRWIGGGLERSAFAAWIEAVDGSGECAMVALVDHDASAAQVQGLEREARLLRFLEERSCGFAVPVRARVVRVDDRSVLVESALDGIQVDLRRPVDDDQGPWMPVARVAAAVHTIPPQELHFLSGHRTQREHGEAVLASLAALADDPRPEVRRTLDWLAAHLPPDDPSCLLHGDLLGPNLLHLLGEPELGLIDWSRAALGDPAYDLAIVTRGVRRPFGVERGLDRLLADYAGAGAAALEPARVRFHELVLHMRWLLAEPGERCEPHEAVLQRVRPMLRELAHRS